MTTLPTLCITGKLVSLWQNLPSLPWHMILPDQGRIQDFRIRGANPLAGAPTYNFYQVFRKTAWNWENYGPLLGAHRECPPPLRSATADRPKSIVIGVADRIWTDELQGQRLKNVIFTFSLSVPSRSISKYAYFWYITLELSLNSAFFCQIDSISSIC